MSEQIRRSEPSATLPVTFGLVGAIAGGVAGRHTYYWNAAPLVRAEHIMANERQQIVGIQKLEHQVDTHLEGEAKVGKAQIAARHLLDHDAQQDIAKLHTEIGAQQYALPIVATGRGVEAMFVSVGAIAGAGLLALASYGVRATMQHYQRLLNSFQAETTNPSEPDQQLVTADAARELEDLYNFDQEL